ncbi:cyclic diguanylate phosphodiesterase (EAL) domain protein [Salmonella enterica subsp. arizonae]|uniref:Cyclic diguanylate phosphodiesterase (EAL) domain protein n=1 Tax=Salmonella enterica subsp. arizonae TaxID=59203 RepID=A0A2X4WB04_SALER|nr:cyclic diguanylate phosphodiesterase (EAL) domain protein [Salmonella enterica subsp. arizonae]
MEIVNIDLLTTMLLEPQQPQITSASLTVGKRHLLYGRGVVDNLPQLKNEERYQRSSQHFLLLSASPGHQQANWRLNICRRSYRWPYC